MPHFPILSAIWLTPLAAAFVILFFNDLKPIRLIALAATLVTAGLTAWATFGGFNLGQAGTLQWVERFDLVPTLHIQYALGVDGISLLMVWLTSFIGFAGVLASWNVEHRSKEFFIMLMVMVAGVFGVFLSTDLFLFFVFYELVLVPKFLMIGIWGTGRKEYSATKLLMMLSAGSALLLISFLALYFGNQAGPGSTFNLFDLAQTGKFSHSFQVIWFPILCLGFAIQAAVWPLHTWVPDGHSSAPTAASMMLAGVVLKLGAYGCLRIAFFILPQGAALWAPVLAVLCLVNVVYASIGAAGQKDIKYVVAYSSVSHMGLVMLGLATLNAVGVDGAVLQMFVHGIMTGLFFALIGMIYGRTHTRQMSELGGLAKVMPFLAAAAVITGMAGLGLPGSGNFVAELLVFLGAYRGSGFVRVVGVLSVASVIFTAVYVLRLVQKTFYGPVTDPHFETLTDARTHEKVLVVAMVVVLLAIGFYPHPVLHLINQAVAPILQRLPGGLN